ncbi:MAG: patatin-like phospholipase family protein [Pseudomonadota bacterium]|nr:patatin-like phospholipase family protein [Pseudomonadota bacterium]
MHWFTFGKRPETPVTGLILPGGGARNAYQAGVIKAVAELIPEEEGNPFPVICGTSSGAINAALLASNALNFQEGVRRMTGVWENFHVGKVFRDDAATAIGNTSRWLLAFLTGRMSGERALSVLDNTPLRHMLESHIRLARIQQSIDCGALRALSITASGYGSGSSITYYQGVEDLPPWERSRRFGIRQEITIDHLMASTAIPMVFPAVKLNGEYHGDGSMRESAPLSPALHLGANRLLIIGARNTISGSVPDDDTELPYPSPGQITGYVFDTLFMDSLEADIERLNRINHTIGETRDRRVEYQGKALRPIEFLVVSPSRDIRELVDLHSRTLPRTVRTLLKAVGAATRGSRPLLSYLLFEASYCRDLLEMGYQDAMNVSGEIRQLLGLEEEPTEPGRVEIAEGGGT